MNRKGAEIDDHYEAEYRKSWRVRHEGENRLVTVVLEFDSFPS
jgi:hypothetical protein